MTTALDTRFEIDVGPQSVQRLLPPSKTERFEGIDFSTSGKVLAIATSDTNAVLLFRRQTNGRFEEAPYARIDKSNAGLDYPHDVSFGRFGDRELLAVAQRAGAIAVYESNGAEGGFG